MGARQRILVTGGTGFVGRQVCEQLVRAGHLVTVPTRRLDRASGIKTFPGLTVREADVHRQDDLLALLPGHDAVVHLVAVLHGNAERFESVHVQLPATLARAMQQCGVRRLVHVSALGADAQGPSMYQRSKARGEALLREAGLDLTVLRPSVIFGAEDRFLNLFARLQALAPIVPLAGGDTRFAPVWVGDVARAVVQALAQPATVGQTYELCGPDVLTLAELVRASGRWAGVRGGRGRPVLSLPLALGWPQALLMEWLPGEPIMSRDNLASMRVDNVASGTLPGLAELGITPARLSGIAPGYLGARGPRSRLDRYRATPR
ncbi:MAG: hypothetical protein RIQ38_2350 [Pseudomonadota bacterium]|jgi:NADH dehydrogenase